MCLGGSASIMRGIYLARAICVNAFFLSENHYIRRVSVCRADDTLEDPIWMIKYTVQCATSHAFEGWFKDSTTFDKQAKKGHVTCPVCGDTKITKAPMAPRLGKSVGKETSNRMAEAAKALRAEVENNCDYVGSQFTEEARRIHYGEADARGIYGEATLDDAKALDDEGIPVLPLPITRGDA